MEMNRNWHWICLVLAVIFMCSCSALNGYQKQGDLRLTGLEESVTVMRDEKGMAYIYANNLEDAIMAQGFVAAQDRLFTMELTRMFAAGRISELAGEEAVALDTRMRTIGFFRHAEKQARLLDPESRLFFQKYIDGVNAFVKTHPDSHHLEFKLAGIKPTPWTIADSLAIVYYMSWNTSANLNTEVIAQMLVEKLGPTRAMEIFPLIINPDDPGTEMTNKPPKIDEPMRLGLATDNPIMGYLKDRLLEIGSNNWAVAAEHSPGGKPIVANDPHLDARILPGPWYPCGIITPELRVVGVNIAGVPGMIVFRNAHVALGITNAYGDTQDLYVEAIDPQNHDHYLEGEQSIPFHVIEETLAIKDKKTPGGFREHKILIRFTRRGPVVSGIFPNFKTDKVLSLRWSLAENMGSKMGMKELIQAQSIAGVHDALKQVNFLMLNFTFADVAGNIGWQVSGHLPIRSKGDGTIPAVVTGSGDNWSGWVPSDEMPQLYNPKRGWIGTCNHNTIPSDYPYYYSSHIAPSYRYRRLQQLLDAQGIKSADSHWQFQRDTRNLMAETIAPVMARALVAHNDSRRLGEILSRWDYHDDPDKSAPTIFQAVYRKFALLVYEDELGEDLAEVMLSNWYFWQERLGKMVVEGNSAWFDNVKTVDVKESRDDLFHQAALAATADLAAEFGKNPDNWLWGKVHQVEFLSPIRRKGIGKGLLGGGSHPALGSGETLGRGIYDFNDPFAVTTMAALRMVADLGDPEKVLAVLPGGVSGRLFDKHNKDQIKSFINGNKVYWWFSDAAIKAHSRNTLVLKP
jgi:penicillin G amidase